MFMICLGINKMLPPSLDFKKAVRPRRDLLKEPGNLGTWGAKKMGYFYIRGIRNFRYRVRYKDE
jgi:hypothetical protein